MLSRDRRKSLGLSQQEVADRAGVSRKWVSEFELGKAGSDFSFVLRLLAVLDLRLQVLPAGHLVAGADTADDIDLDALLERYAERDGEARSIAEGDT